jgi:hypothetical protein
LVVRFVVGCTTSDSPALVDGGHPLDDATTKPPTEAGGCAACIATSCARAEGICEADPTCARYLSCIHTCSPNNGTTDDTQCTSRCDDVVSDGGGGGSNSAAAASSALAHDALKACHASAVKRCTACAERTTYQSARLNQACSGAVPPLPPASACDPPRDAIDIACRDCQHKKCCNTRSACENDPACSALLGCLGRSPCSDAGGSVEGCFAQHPTSVATWSDNRGCAFVRCPTECGARSDPCRECQQQQCGDEYAAFVASGAGGTLLSGCLEACENDDCEYDCKKLYPLSVKPLSEFLLCYTSRCTAVCPE